MKKKLFYVVSPQLEDIDGIGETNGFKDINVYSIVGDNMENQFNIVCPLEENSEDEIEDYLIDNGMGDDEFELIQI